MRRVRGARAMNRFGALGRAGLGLAIAALLAGGCLRRLEDASTTPSTAAVPAAAAAVQPEAAAEAVQPAVAAEAVQPAVVAAAVQPVAATEVIPPPPPPAPL